MPIFPLAKKVNSCKADKKPYMRAFTPSDPASFLDSLNVK
jgi:hypothetical protein